MREILVSGSSAHDTIIHYAGNFKEQFQGDNMEQGLHMSLLCHQYEKYIGGTGLNIAYNLILLGENPVLLSSVGVDFTGDGVIDDKINTKYLHRDRKRITAGSTILTDENEHKITAFYPGAMEEADQTHVSYVTESLGLGIVSANKVSAMMGHARELHKEGVKFFADPAQQITDMSKEQLQELLELADYLIVNQYEMKELQVKSGYAEDILKEKFEKIIVTYGSNGSELIEGDHITHIPIISVEDVEDPTGTGDAYRAGVLKAIIDGHSWKTACRLGTILASYCIQVEGAQNHHFNISNVSQDMKTYFDEDIDLHARRKY